MAQQTKKRKRRVRRKVKLKQSLAIVRKDSVQSDTLRRDTLPRMKAQMPRTVAPVLKVKIRKKSGN